MEKVVILGTGCAGSTAAIYTARANLQPLVFEGQEPGGQLMLTTDVENYPGFPEGIPGSELVQKMKEQAVKFGARIKFGRATEIKKINGGFEVTIDKKDKVQARAVIVSTGASARWLGLESEEKYKGRGISTCAVCDAAFHKDSEGVVVVGGGDSACEEAGILSKFAKHVTIIVRKDKMRASKVMQDRIAGNPKVDIKLNTEIEEVIGDGKKVTGVKLINNKTNETEDVPVSGVFLAIGHIPNTDFCKGLVDLDEHGFVKTENTRTNVEGVFACGDVQDPVYKQAITAAGSGCKAALEAERYLEL